MQNNEDILGDVTPQELIRMTTDLAQELEDFVAAGEEGGSDMSAVRALLNDWEAMFRRTRLSWQYHHRAADDGQPLPEGLAKL